MSTSFMPKVFYLKALFKKQAVWLIELQYVGNGLKCEPSFVIPFIKRTVYSICPVFSSSL